MLAEYEFEQKHVLTNSDKCALRLFGFKRHVMTNYVQHFLNEVWRDVLSQHEPQIDDANSATVASKLAATYLPYKQTSFRRVFLKIHAFIFFLILCISP